MTTKRSGSKKQAEVEAISEELNTTLRLGRADEAIKELLAFVEDGDFFARNASTGRRRRLRSLQNALAKALG